MPLYCPATLSEPRCTGRWRLSPVDVVKRKRVFRRAETAPAFAVEVQIEWHLRNGLFGQTTKTFMGWRLATREEIQTLCAAKRITD